MTNPLKRDPSRTLALRRRAVADMKRKFKKAKKDIKDLVSKQDAFGLKEQVTPMVSLNQVFAFQTDPQKVASFRIWLQTQVANNILFTANTTEPWLDEYVESAYKRGVARGFSQVRPIAAEEGLAFFEGTKAEFLSASFAAPESVAKLQSLFSRSFLSLKNITDTMDSQLSILLTQGLADGLHPDVIAANMVRAINGLEKRRALALARTEIVRAQAEGQLDSFEKLGVEEVGILAEWSTAGDDKVCAQCEPLDGAVLTVQEARGLLPRHPNCRCAYVPALIGIRQPGQVWETAKVKSALKKSTLARTKKGTTLKEARAKSPWQGSQTKISGEGRE